MQDGGGQGQLSHYKVLEMVQKYEIPRAGKTGIEK